jgi:TetR/AcrR family transcriptional regulator, transcriptional repressor of aconitase
MDAEDRKRAIVEAARACFLQFGYAKTSMDDIAKKAGISRPLVYRAFKNKEAIFAAAYEATFEERFPKALAIVKGRGSKREKVLAVCETLVIQPWEELHRSPMLDEYFAACAALLPEAQAAHEKKKLAIAKALLGDRDLAELFLMSAEGLMLDLPSPATLRKRMTMLVERFL